MTKQAAEDGRLVKLTAICLALPETTRSFQGNHVSFLVRRKTFAYFLKDHHGDGIVSVCCKALVADSGPLVKANPERFYLPAYIGPRGWVAFRLDAGKVDWDEVSELVVHSYCLTATKRLAAEARACSGG